MKRTMKIPIAFFCYQFCYHLRVLLRFSPLKRSNNNNNNNKTNYKTKSYYKDIKLHCSQQKYFAVMGSQTSSEL